MNSQTMLCAFGGKCGFPSGGCHGPTVSARTIPSRANMAPRTRPVNPIPRSARNARRWIPWFIITLPNRNKIVVIQQRLHQAGAHVALVARRWLLFPNGTPGRQRLSANGNLVRRRLDAKYDQERRTYKLLVRATGG